MGAFPFRFALVVILFLTVVVVVVVALSVGLFVCLFVVPFGFDSLAKRLTSALGVEIHSCSFVPPSNCCVLRSSLRSCLISVSFFSGTCFTFYSLANIRVCYFCPLCSSFYSFLPSLLVFFDNLLTVTFSAHFVGQQKEL